MAISTKEPMKEMDVKTTAVVAIFFPPSSLQQHLQVIKDAAIRTKTGHMIIQGNVRIAIIT